MWVRAAVLAIAVFAAQDAEPLKFEDDFERGLDRWRIVGQNTVRVRPSGDPAHGQVMELAPNGDAAAIIRQSASWGRVRVEGDMLFPGGGDNYLGFLYNFTERAARQDFGLIYLKGNDNYLQANPHRDFNVSRLVYPESRAALAGEARVGVNTWHRFAFEIDGPVAHVYIGPSAVPQITFDLFEYTRGDIGFQPRSVGAPVWIDNVKVRAIDRLSYAGPPVPAPRYDPGALLTRWEVAGPFDATNDRLAQQPAGAKWSVFSTDRRGAVVTGRITDYHGARTVAYFRSVIDVETAGDGEIQFSTADDLAVWLNGEFQAFLARQDAAWFDFPVNQAHAPRRLPVSFKAGRNDVVVRVRGGVYASGGFFARPVKATPGRLLRLR